MTPSNAHLLSGIPSIDTPIIIHHLCTRLHNFPTKRGLWLVQTSACCWRSSLEQPHHHHHHHEKCSNTITTRSVLVQWCVYHPDWWLLISYQYRIDIIEYQYHSNITLTLYLSCSILSQQEESRLNYPTSRWDESWIKCINIDVHIDTIAISY